MAKRKGSRRCERKGTEGANGRRKVGRRLRAPKNHGNRFFNTTREVPKDPMETSVRKNGWERERTKKGEGAVGSRRKHQSIEGAEPGI